MKFNKEFANQIIDDLINCVNAASKEIMQIYNSDNFETSDKADGSPLTLADKASNQIITEGLRKVTPDIAVISEETFEDTILKELPNLYWLVDPLDGTREFINKNDEFTVNIALIEDRKPVFGIVAAPVFEKCWHGSIFDNYHSDKSIPDVLRIVMSKSHKSDNDKSFLNYLNEKGVNYKIIEKGSSLKLCAIADNEADIYPRFGPTSEWDIAAAHSVLSAYGGCVLKVDDFSDLSYAKKESILNPYFICMRNNSIKDAFLPILGDFLKKLV